MEIEKRIIGTWVDQNGTTWVFNANGTYIRTWSTVSSEYKFGVTDIKLASYELLRRAL